VEPSGCCSPPEGTRGYGVKRKQSIPPALIKEMYRVGGRRGHYRAFMSLVHHWPGWEKAPYRTTIATPVITNAPAQIRSRFTHAFRRNRTPTFSYTITAIKPVTSR
jgi:hypothetical protein